MLNTIPESNADVLTVDWLQLVCGTEVSARFWTTFAFVLLVMGPLFLVFTAGGATANLADFVRRRVEEISAARDASAAE